MAAAVGFRCRCCATPSASGQTVVRLAAHISAGITAGLILACNPSHAETPSASCTLLGQVSTSTFLSMVGALSANDESAVDQTTQRLANLTTSYATLGCDTAALNRVMECVLTSEGAGTAREVARGCLLTEGLAAE